MKRVIKTNINHEIQSQKALEKKLNCKFIRINPDEKNFNTYKANNEIFRHKGINQGNN